MSTKLQILMIFTSVGGFLLMVYFIKKNVIELKYSLVWLFIALSTIGLAFFPGLLVSISKVMSIQTPVNTLFFIGFYFLLMLLFSITVIVSRNNLRIKTLNQELALLKEKVERRAHHE